MEMLQIILLVIAMVMFLGATFLRWGQGQGPQIHLGWLGMFFLALALILGVAT